MSWIPIVSLEFVRFVKVLLEDAVNRGKICPMDRIRKNNGNLRYPNLKTDFFKEIDSAEKAYLLGWIASDGTVSSGTISIAIRESDSGILYSFQKTLGGGKISTKKNQPEWEPLRSFTFSSVEMVQSVCGWLSISPGKKSAIVKMPEFNDAALDWAFLRGLFDGDGSIRTPTVDKRSPECSIASSSPEMKKRIHAVAGGRIDKHGVHWSGANAMDFMQKLYFDKTCLALPRKEDLYYEWSTWAPSIGCNFKADPLRFSTCREEALPIVKPRITDTGYDIAVVAEVKRVGDVVLYGTGLKVKPPYGWYLDLVPRSSIIKSGYQLANSVGVIDQTYVGEILVPLRKVDPDAPDLPIPSRVVQLILRPVVHMDFEMVESLESTNRGAGGFGSTGT